MTIPTYEVIFVKKNGQRRIMVFSFLRDMPADFINSRLKQTRKHELGAGMELVWDHEESDFRIFNRLTAIGGVKKVEDREI